jgi:hypothetical protein
VARLNTQWLEKSYNQPGSILSLYLFTTFIQSIQIMGFHINDKKDNKKGGKSAKNMLAGSKPASKSAKPSGGGGKKMIKTGGTRGS